MMISHEEILEAGKSFAYCYEGADTVLFRVREIKIAPDNPSKGIHLEYFGVYVAKVMCPMAVANGLIPARGINGEIETPFTTGLKVIVHNLSDETQPVKIEFTIEEEKS